ncbi:Sirohydrochlorin chelatase OS=Streptomyces tendae OX=1932 GN=GUR47_31510 PE=4 SV=1 [Streptomyces tendae]
MPLTRAFHAKADIPAVLGGGAAAAAGIRQAEVLGPSPLLLAALERRLYEAGLTPADKSSTGVVLASAGSSDPEAIAVIADIAREWRLTGWCAVRPGVRLRRRSRGVPRTEDAVRRAAGARRCALRRRGPVRAGAGPAAGPDRAGRGRGGACWRTCWGPSPEVARVLLERYDAGAGAAG